MTAASNVYGNILPWFEEALAAFHKQAVLQHVVSQGSAFLPVRSDSRSHLILATKQCKVTGGYVAHKAKLFTVAK